MYRVSAKKIFDIILKAIILKTIKSRSSMKRNGSGVEHNEFVKGRVSTKVNRCAACDTGTHQQGVPVSQLSDCVSRLHFGSERRDST